MTNRKNKLFLLILLLINVLYLFGIGYFSTSKYVKAEDDVVISDLSLTINELNGRGSATSTVGNYFNVNKVSSSNGVGIYTVSLNRIGYVFNSDLSLKVNGKNRTDYEMGNNNKGFSITYEASKNFVELYEGSTKIESLIAFGTIDKSQLASNSKTIKIKNIGSITTGALSLSIIPSSTGGSNSASGGSASSSSADSESSSSVIPFSVTSSINAIAANQEATFVITPLSTISAGTYNVNLKIKSSVTNAYNGYSIDLSIPLSITVTENIKFNVYDGTLKLSNGYEFDFGTIDIDDASTITKTLTFKNEGTLEITALEIELSTTALSIDKSAIESLNVDGSFTVTITVNPNATAGDYQYCPLSWKNGDESISGYVVFKIKITEKDPYILEAYNNTIKMTPSYTYNFGSTEYGSSAPNAHTFRIVNAGSKATGDLTVYLDSKSTAGFECVTSIPSIAKGGEAELSIKPKDNLAKGTYTATVNVYNTNCSVTFKLNYVVTQKTEITSISISSSNIVAPVTDAAIQVKNSSGTGYSCNIIYQEKSGNEWIGVTSSTFKAGKTYRIKVMASITNKTSYIYGSSVSMMLGNESAEEVSVNESRELVVGYKTFEALPASEYSLEMICASNNFSDNTYAFSLVDEYSGGESILFTFNNLGTKETEDLTVSFKIYNTSNPGTSFEYYPEIESIKSGESYILEVKPVLGLDPNPLDYYWETVTVSNNHFNITFDIKLRVEKKTDKMIVEFHHNEYNPSYDDVEDITHKLIGGDTFYYSFDYLLDIANRPYEKLKVGYSSNDANRFTPSNFQIVNRGQNTLTNITVTHSGPGDSYFNFDTSNLTSSVAASNYQKKYTRFGVSIKTGAPAGTHKTTLVIKADNIDPIIITFAFTVNIEIENVVIKGLTIPEGYDKAPRDLTVETEGVYIRLMGWNKIGNALWLGKNNNIFNGGDTYKLNIHLNTKTGYVFKNYSNDNTWAGSKIAFRFTIEFDGVDIEAEITAGNIVNHSLNNPTFGADSCYYTLTFVAKAPTVKGTAVIESYDYLNEYTLNASYGVEGLDQGSNLRFKWYKDGLAINNVPSTDSYISIPKNTIDKDASYYYEITHISREGTLRSETVVIGPNTRLKPSTTIIKVNSPISCIEKGKITYYRDGLEYRIASPYDDISDTFNDWLVAEVTLQQNTGTGTGTGTSGTGGTQTEQYIGKIENINGGSIYWFRYKETITLSPSEIGVFTVETGNHTLEHHDGIMPEPREICEVDGVKEYNYCTICHKYYDMDDNEFDSIDYLTSFATGHKDENGDLFCDYCHESIMNKYYFRVNSLNDIVTGAKYIITDQDGRIMSNLDISSSNGGKYVDALTINRLEADIEADRYKSTDIDKINAFIFEIKIIPSKSTNDKNCYAFYVSDACIDFSSGLILSIKQWEERLGFSIIEKDNDTFEISMFDDDVKLSYGLLNNITNVFSYNASNKVTVTSSNLKIYKLVSLSTTLNDKNVEINEKKVITDYDVLSEDFTQEGMKSDVSGVIDAISEDYIKVFAQKQNLDEDNMKFDIKSSIEVTEKKDDEITLDVHPTISCGEKVETISDRNLNGNEMTLTLFVGNEVPEKVTHRLTSGGVEYFYKVKETEDQKTFTYEIDNDGNVYVTFKVTEFSIFVVTLPLSPDPITGTVTIDGEAEVGETLTIEIKDTNVDNETLVITWYKDNSVISGANGSSYTLTEEDKGFKIKVSVSDSIHSGLIVSTQTSEVKEKETPQSKVENNNKPSVNKEDCSTCISSDGKITNLNSTMEYSLNKTSWNDISSDKLENLSSGTYYIRYKETLTMYASLETEIVISKGSHNYNIEYTWNNDYSKCTATATCTHNSEHKEVETVNSTSTITQERSTTKDELTTYTATFTNALFEVQVKEDIVTNTKLEVITYTVIFKDYDGTTISSEVYNFGDTIAEPSNPTRESDNTYSYIFDGWDKTITKCDGDKTYTATYKESYIEYTVIFKNYDGSELLRKNYHYNDIVAAPTTNPTKPSDNTYNYSFSGWDKELTKVTKNETYTAKYSETYIEYVIIFKNYDGSELLKKNYHFNDTIIAPTNNPTKESDNSYSYTFSGWDKVITKCDGDKVYTAKYLETYIDYVIIFRNYDGTELLRKNYHYNDIVTVPSSNPTKPSDDTYNYVFTGWDKEVVKVIKDEIYIAVFVSSPIINSDDDSELYNRLVAEIDSITSINLNSYNVIKSIISRSEGLTSEHKSSINSKLEPKIEEYENFVKAINNEYAIGVQVENNFFISVIEVISYLSILSYIVLKGRKWFL